MNFDPHEPGPHEPVWRTSFRLEKGDEFVRRKFDSTAPTLGDHIKLFNTEYAGRTDVTPTCHGMLWTRNNHLIDWSAYL